jgi:hypothetical protein
MTVSAMQSCIGAVAAAHPSVLPAVQEWLLDRLRWEDRLRMIGAAAALHGGPIEMGDATPDSETAELKRV